MKTTLIIGGLDAQLWINRRVRIIRKNGHRHAGRAVLISVSSRGTAVIKPTGHKHTEVVPLSEVHPWWSQNSDLKAADSLPRST